jgi:hypothetical protein
MNGDELAARLDKIARRFLELHRAGIDQQCQINALATAVMSAFPALRSTFDGQLNAERAKNSEQIREIERQLQALRQGISKPSDFLN